MTIQTPEVQLETLQCPKQHTYYVPVGLDSWLSLKNERGEVLFNVVPREVCPTCWREMIEPTIGKVVAGPPDIREVMRELQTLRRLVKGESE